MTQGTRSTVLKQDTYLRIQRKLQGKSAPFLGTVDTVNIWDYNCIYHYFIIEQYPFGFAFIFMSSPYLWVMEKPRYGIQE